ncbi:MAG: tetratricopeptide repeat protein [Betaproteobacteria bacterium]
MLSWFLAVSVFALPGAFAGSRLGRIAPASQGLWEEVLRENAPLGDPQSFFWLAVAHANLGQLEESRTAFERWDKADPQRKTTKLLVSESRALLAQDPGDLQGLNGLAFLAYAEGNYAEAINYFQSVVSIDEQNPWPRCYLGFSLGKNGQVNAAVKVLEEGVRLFPDNEVLHFLLGMAYYRKGLFARALLEMAKAPGALRYFR